MTAIEKINNEMQKNASDPYTEIIGQYVIDRCSDNIIAMMVDKPGKTLSGAMKQVMDAASKKKHDSVAVMSDSEVFTIIDNYFGMPEDKEAQRRAVGESTQPSKPSGMLDLSDYL